MCVSSVAKPVSETGIIAVPIAVKAHQPMAASRETDPVRRISAVSEIEHDDHIIAVTSLIPAVKRNHVIDVVDVMNVNVLSPEAARIVKPVAPKMNEIAVKLNDPRKGVGMGPIERLTGIEIAP